MSKGVSFYNSKEARIVLTRFFFLSSGEGRCKWADWTSPIFSEIEVRNFNILELMSYGGFMILSFDSIAKVDIILLVKNEVFG